LRGPEFATAVFDVVVQEANLFLVRLDAVRCFLAEPLIEGVLVVIVIRRLLVIARRDLAFLSVASDLLLGQGAHYVRLTLGIEVFVLGKRRVAGAAPGARRGVEIGDALRVEVVIGVLILLSHSSLIPFMTP